MEFRLAAGRNGSFSPAIYELLSERSQEVVSPSQLRGEQAHYQTSIDEGTKGVALKVQAVVDRHYAIVDWQSNLEVLREMRRDIKRELRPAGDYTEAQLDELRTGSSKWHAGGASGERAGQCPLRQYDHRL